MISEFNSRKIRLNVENETNYNEKDILDGLLDILFINKSTSINYEIGKDSLKFLSKERNNLYNGEIEFKPFYFSANFNYDGLSTKNLFNDDSIFIDLIRSEILNNKNLNFDLNIHGNKIKDFSDFADIKLNLKIREGLIDIDDTEFYWKNNLNFFLKDSLIYVKDGELILDGKLNLNFKNYDEIYKFLITPKKYRKELTNIKADFVYNFDQKIVNFDNILINNKRNKELNQILERLTFKKTKIQNKVYIKNILNRALKSYAG
jgi:hypothetical protein